MNSSYFSKVKQFLNIGDIARFCNITDQHTYKIMNGTKPISYKTSLHLYSLCLSLRNECERMILVKKEDGECFKDLLAKNCIIDSIIYNFEIPEMPKTFKIKWV